MEIPSIINNLEEFNHVPSDIELNSIIEELSKFSFEDFIYMDYLGNNNNLDLMELFRKLVNKICDEINENSNEKLVSIIKSLISIFQKGLNEDNLIYFFIFLHANNIINLPIDVLIKKYNLIDKFHKILKKIFKILDNIEIHAVDKTFYMYFNKMKTDNKEKTLITSLREIDFEKNKPLLKYSNISLPNHFYQMIEILYEYDLESFEKLLASDNIFTLVLIIKCMSFNQINIFFVNHDEIKEKTLICFLLKFLRSTSDDKIKYQDIIVNRCIQLYKLNKTLFEGLMDVFMYDEFFNEILGLMFCKLSKEDLYNIFESIPLNNNPCQINIRNKMFEKCNGCENSNYIFELIYKKWINHLLNYYNKKETALNILCTDFCNFIVAYYFFKYDDEKLLNSMKNLFIKLKNLDSEWSYNFIHHRNKFFVYYSKLFIFSVLYNEYNLYDNEIKEYYNEFYDEYVLFKKFFDNRKENFLDQFEKNLIGKHRNNNTNL